MDLNQFSLLIIVAVSAVFVFEIFALTLYACSRQVRTQLQNIPYTYYLLAIGALSLASTVGALIFQLWYLTPVCELCWWQRVFMFPITIIVGVALYSKDRFAHITTGILTLIGGFYAAYHYYYHYQGLVLGKTLSLPCSTFGLLPSCTDSAILIFGFVTIPLMALLSFGALLILMYLAHYSQSRTQI